MKLIKKYILFINVQKILQIFETAGFLQSRDTVIDVIVVVRRRAAQCIRQSTDSQIFFV